MKQLRISIVFTVIIVLFCISGQSRAQTSKVWRMLQHNDSLLTTRYRRGNIDTMYITRPQTKWTVTGRYNVSEMKTEMEGKQMGIPFKSEMYADYKSTFSLGLKYLGVSLSLSLNPAKMMGKYHDYELSVSSYTNRWGVDLVYQDASNFTGWHEMDGETGKTYIELPPEVLEMKILNVNAYYAFNHRRFSYPAAFTQSYIQRRSAGSFMLALSGQGQKAETNGIFESLLKVTNIGIGGGYGYNWVPARRWLLHLSALPTLIVYSNTLLKVYDDRIPLDYHFPEVIITARGAIIRQFGNMFAGATMVYNYTNVGDRDRLLIQSTKWRARVFVGYRF